ncbi:hypothetical protein AB0J43_52740 [Nonomuraea fuscirosea]
MISAVSGCHWQATSFYLFDLGGAGGAGEWSFIRREDRRRDRRAARRELRAHRHGR